MGQPEIDALNTVSESLKELIYGAHWEHLEKPVQDALLSALEATEVSGDTTPEEPIRDETPTACTARNCGRTRPRWTMELVGKAWVCSPVNNMHCAQCCPPGSYLTHYSEGEHRHPQMDEDDRICGLCGAVHDERDMHQYAHRYLCKTHEGTEVTTWVASLPL